MNSSWEKLEFSTTVKRRLNTYSDCFFCIRLALIGGFSWKLLLSHHPTGNNLWESMSSIWLGISRMWSRCTHSKGPAILVIVAAQIWLGLTGLTASSFIPRSNSCSSVPCQAHCMFTHVITVVSSLLVQLNSFTQFKHLKMAIKLSDHSGTKKINLVTQLLAHLSKKKLFKIQQTLVFL